MCYWLPWGIPVDACACLPINSVSQQIAAAFPLHVSTREWHDSQCLILNHLFFIRTKFISPRLKSELLSTRGGLRLLRVAVWWWRDNVKHLLLLSPCKCFDQWITVAFNQPGLPQSSNHTSGCSAEAEVAGPAWLLISSWGSEVIKRGWMKSIRLYYYFGGAAHWRFDRAETDYESLGKNRSEWGGIVLADRWA